MKRFIFWLLMIVAVTIVSYYTLIMMATDAVFYSNNLQWLVPSGQNLETGWLFIIYFFENFGLIWDLGFNVDTVPLFALMIFLIMNVLLLLWLIMGFLFTAGSLSRVRGLYGTASWFFSAAFIFMGAWAYVVYFATTNGVPFGDALGALPWQIYIPIGASFFFLVLSFILRRSERFKY